MNQPDTVTLPPARRANDYLIGHKRFREPEMLFDEFWRAGELALFFGAAGSGKSILAVQLADALSRRGGGLHGFRGPLGRRRLLYVDLRHTDEQFRMRCMRNADTPVRNERGAFADRNDEFRPAGLLRTGVSAFHRFPRNLLRDRPAPGQDLCEWLRAYVTANRVQAVIVDDLSAVKNTHDDTRETLQLMRRLRELRDELRISILVLAGSNEPRSGKPVSEADLGRSRVLCTAADSVFAAGRGRSCDGDHYLVQTRAGSARPYWTWRNAPTAHVSRTATGLLSFEFDERFGEKMTAEKRRLICEVSRLHEVELRTFREIARQLNISKSWACELYRKWTPAMDSEQWSVDSEQLTAGSGPPDLEHEDYSAGGNTTGRECAPLDETRIEDDDRDESEIPEHESEWPDEGGNTTGRECAPNNDTSAGADQESSPHYEGGVSAPVFQGADGVVLSHSRSTQNNPESTSADVEENHPGLRPSLLRKEGSLSDIDVSAIPFAAALARRSIHDLALGHDGYGNEIYIETRCGHTGKPAVWYQLDKKGTKRRFTRNPLGIQVEHLDAGPFL